MPGDKSLSGLTQKILEIPVCWLHIKQGSLAPTGEMSLLNSDTQPKAFISMSPAQDTPAGTSHNSSLPGASNNSSLTTPVTFGNAL